MDINESFYNVIGSNNTCSDGFSIFKFSINALIGSILILVGIVGNIISIIVLNRDWSRSSMSVLLSGLGMYDILFLILSIYYIIVYDGIKVIADEDFKSKILYLNNLIMKPAWYLGNVFRCGRNWIAVIVAIDRFVVVYRPFQAHSRSNPKRAKLYSLSIAILALFYNIPRLWEWKEIKTKSIIRLIPNPDLGQTYHLIYGSILFAIFNIIGPMILLIIFNTLLAISVIKASKRRQVLINNQIGSSRRTRETKMLVVVIGVFIVTETPSCAWQIIMKHIQQSCIGQSILSFVDILTVLNSSLNFFIYCICGLRFRQNLQKVFHFRCQTNYSVRNTTSNAGSVCVTGYLGNSVHQHLSATENDKFVRETVM